MGDAIITRRGGRNARLQYIISASSTFTVERSGKYRIVVIGKGGDGTPGTTSGSRSTMPGACGGGGYIERFLTQGQAFPIVINVSYTDFGNNLIRATAATVVDHSPISGTVSGTATDIVPFASNESSVMSIVPPDMYNSDFYIRRGGIGGNLNGGAYVSDGGAGLFGNDGGAGASMTTGVIGAEAVGTPSPGGRGNGVAGQGGSSLAGGSTASSGVRFAPGRGGGASFGGGGSPCAVTYYSYGSGYRYQYGAAGQGGGGGVFIELI